MFSAQRGLSISLKVALLHDFEIRHESIPMPVLKSNRGHCRIVAPRSSVMWTFRGRCGASADFLELSNASKLAFVEVKAKTLEKRLQRGPSNRQFGGFGEEDHLFHCKPVV
jgi:hypothetical protein